MQEALGELAGAAKEGLMALSVGVGLGVWPSAGPCVGGPWLVPLRLSARVTSLRSAPQHRAPRTVLLSRKAGALSTRMKVAHTRRPRPSLAQGRHRQ